MRPQPHFRQSSFELTVLFFFLCLSALFLAATSAGAALGPDQVVVLANQNASGSVKLARYYMGKRAIPEKHLFLLRVTDNELCSREDYDRDVAPRVREFLRKIDPPGNIRCLVTMYGLPLKIAPPAMRKEERVQLEELRKKQQGISEELKAVSKEETEKRKRLESDLDAVRKEINAITKEDYGSAFDSELTMVRLEDYSLSRWILNPMFVGFGKRKLEISADGVLMISRLDGPTEDIVKRIIDDSVEVEKKGLKGTAYFDARWRKPEGERAKQADSGYAYYDRSIHLAAERIGKSGRMPVVVDSEERLFKEGECPEAALYCGWYSLARYIGAFSWKPGAVGYHIASGECATLKKENSQVWCKRMLEEGVAATVGPVSEPYVDGFPVPEVFFGLLAEGRLTLAECYALSVPYLSWRMVLIGDPLYRPFRRQ